MSIRKVFAVTLGSLALMSVMALPASAQTAAAKAPAKAAMSSSDDAKAELGFGYVFARNIDDKKNLPLGFGIDVAGAVNKNVSIVGEFVGDATSDSPRHKEWYYGAGPRINVGGSSKAKPFFQVIAGGVRSEGENAFYLQPGVGVNSWFSDKAGVRIQGDYRWLRHDGDNIKGFRFFGGVVVKIK